MAVSKAQRKASDKWDNENRERKNYINKRSHARGFIKTLATLEDLQEIKELVASREQQIKHRKEPK